MPKLSGIHKPSEYERFQNLFINGAFDHWQRGTSGLAITTANNYQADRWICKTAGGLASATLSRSTSIPSDVDVSFSARADYTPTANGHRIDFDQRIESNLVREIFNTPVDISCWVRTDSAGEVFMQARAANALDDFSGATGLDFEIQSVNATGSWQRIIFKNYLLSNAQALNGIGLLFAFRDQSNTGNASFIEFTGVQIVKSSPITLDFQRHKGDSAAELAACQRYYYRLTSNSGQTYIGGGACSNTSTSFCTLDLPVTMRAAPTLESTGIASDYRTFHRLSGSGSVATSTPSLFSADEGTVGIGWNSTGAFVAGDGCVLATNFVGPSSPNIFLGFDAEL